MKNLKEYLRVQEASQLLGVSIVTLHRWDAKGKLKSLRHPINNYRLYKRSDIERILKKINQK